MSKRNKWWLLYLRAYMNYGALEAKIIDKEFDSELDLLVWASKSMIPKAVGQHWIVSPRGLERLPTEIYGRIEQLKRAEIDKVKLDEAKQIRRERKAKAMKEHELREKRKQKQAQKEAQCVNG